MAILFNSKRKKEHLDIIRTKHTTSNSTTGFESIVFVPKSLPELNFEEIDTSLNFLDKKISAPILISSMTGGTEEALKINQVLARVAEACKIPIALGSLKAMILHPELTYTYSIREFAPSVPIIGNIGIDYLLSDQYSYEELMRACKTIDVDALYIHINPLQELAQPEGFKDFRGALKRIEEVCRRSKIPILVKEVGDGISPEAAIELEKAGAKIIDIAGSGGTSWSAVEGFRGSLIGESFRDWGLPTALSLLAIKKKTNVPLIASGGIKNGQEVAKGIAMGAMMCGIARPFALAAFKGEKYLKIEVEKMILELKTTMLLVGAKDLSALRSTKFLIKSELKDLLEQIAKI